VESVSERALFTYARARAFGVRGGKGPTGKGFFSQLKIFNFTSIFGSSASWQIQILGDKSEPETSSHTSNGN
jgi:hypothetical protein